MMPDVGRGVLDAENGTGKEVKGKRTPVTEGEPDVRRAVSAAFRRMAFLFANLVCGIWVILLVAAAGVWKAPAGPGTVLLLVLGTAPLAYALPYGLVRLVGLVVGIVKARTQGRA